MAGAERVVDVNIGERGQLLGEFGVAFLFTRLEPEVFENDHFTVLLSGDFRFGIVADGVGGKHYLVRDQFGKAVGGRL